MGLKVYSVCAYYSRTDEEWTQDTYHASKFVKAIKGKEVKGWAEIPVPLDGKRRDLREANKEDAFGMFAEMIAPHLDHIDGRIALIPVPGSDCTTIREVQNCRTYRLCREIAKQIDRARVVTALRWKRPQPKAHEGGSRDPAELAPELEVAKLIVKVERQLNATFVLVDDVVTTRGHLRAARAVLGQVGAPVDLAVCVGKTVLSQPEQIFDLFVDECEPFELP